MRFHTLISIGEAHFSAGPWKIGTHIINGTFKTHDELIGPINNSTRRHTLWLDSQPWKFIR